MNPKDVEMMVEEFFHGQYKLDRYLGTGAFANVYLVKHRYLNDLVAMKINREPFSKLSLWKRELSI
ncbi:MAG: hypothetical protein BZ137_00680 [Methanosphaera sp. rholeuAM130]|nr:MAG: hypothetical protein BZ137_00680 [Methanosphaera sp. rholeuAM130]